MANKPQPDKKIVFAALGALLFLCLLLGAAIYLINNLKDTPGPAQQAGNNTPTPAVTQSVTPTVTPTATPVLVTQKQLNFKSYKFMINGVSSSEASQYFWKSSTPTTTILTNPVDLFNDLAKYSGLVYFPSLDKFYDAGGSSLISWSIATDTQITDLAKNRMLSTDAASGRIIKTNCVKSFGRVGVNIWNTVDCAELWNEVPAAPTTFYMDNIQRSCYESFAPGKYLLVTYERNSAGSDGDACQYLNSLGIQNINYSK